MLHIARTGYNLQARKVLTHQLGHFHALRDIVNRQHQHAGLGSTSGAHQVQAGGVAIKNTPAPFAQGFNRFGIVVEHRGGDAVSVEQATHNLAVAAEARNDDGIVLRLVNFLHGGAACATQARNPPAVCQHQEQGCEQHG